MVCFVRGEVCGLLGLSNWLSEGLQRAGVLGGYVFNERVY